MKDLYEILEVTRDAIEEVVKKNYRRLLLQYHPDKAEDEDTKKEHAKKYKEIVIAYKILSDPQKRGKYESSLASTFDELTDLYSKGALDYYINTDDLNEDGEFDDDKFNKKFIDKHLEDLNVVEERDAPNTLDEIESILAERQRQVYEEEKNRSMGPFMNGSKFDANLFNQVFNQHNPMTNTGKEICEIHETEGVSNLMSTMVGGEEFEGALSKDKPHAELLEQGKRAINFTEINFDANNDVTAPDVKMKGEDMNTLLDRTIKDRLKDLNIEENNYVILDKHKEGLEWPA